MMETSPGQIVSIRFAQRLYQCRKKRIFFIYLHERIKKTHLFFYIFMCLIFINTQKELYQIPTLPLQQEIEPRAVLKQMTKSHRRIVLTV